MISGIPNVSGAQSNSAAVQFNPSPNIQVKASALTGEVLDVQSVHPSSLDSLRETATQQSGVRSDMIEKGSAFLADPNYPPLDVVNGISSLIINDFFLKKPGAPAE